MKFKESIACVAIILLAGLSQACTHTQHQHSNDLLPLDLGHTATIVVTPTFTPAAPTINPTSTNTPIPTPTPGKEILVEYTYSNGDGVDEVVRCLAGEAHIFKLFKDGQLLYMDGSHLKESYLSEQEIGLLLDKLENTGFLDIAGDGSEREKDPIYKNAPDRVGDGAGYSFITVKDKSIAYYWALRDYLVDPITLTLDLIKSFEPRTSETHIPDNITLLVFAIKDSSTIVFSPTPIPPIEPWNHSSISLADLREQSSGYFLYLDRDTTKSLVDVFGQIPLGKIYIEEGQEYYVVACMDPPF